MTGKRFVDPPSRADWVDEIVNYLRVYGKLDKDDADSLRRSLLQLSTADLEALASAILGIIAASLPPDTAS